MAEVRVTKMTETPAYDVLPGFPLIGRDLLRTNLLGFEPFTMMRRFGDELERVFGKGAEAAAWRPAIDVKLEKGRMLVHAELPGLKKENVKVAVTGDLLTIEGERRAETEEKKGSWTHTERNYGKFYRAITLPEGADTEKVAAEFADGVLAITIPVPEVTPTVKEIPVGEAAPKAEVKH
jgi:HSP20 family protein